MTQRRINSSKKEKDQKQREKEKKALLLLKSRTNLRDIKTKFRDAFERFCTYNRIDIDKEANKISQMTIANIRKKYKLTDIEFTDTITLINTVYRISFNPVLASEDSSLDPKYIISLEYIFKSPILEAIYFEYMEVLDAREKLRNPKSQKTQVHIISLGRGKR